MAGMKILWISHFVPYPPKGGCFQRSYNLIREVAKNNDVYLVALRHKDKSTHPESEMVKAKDALGEFCKEVHILDINTFSGVKYYLLALKSIFTNDPLTVNLFKSKQMHEVVKSLSNRIPFDIAHYDTISLAEYINDTCDIPKFLTHHGVESFMIRRRISNESNYLKKIYLFIEFKKLCRYEKYNCSRFAMNIAVSNDDKKMLSDISPGLKIDVVENGVDVNFFLPKTKHDNTNRLIFAGRLDQYSNMDAVINFCTNIWPLVKEKIPGIRFTIIGNNPPQKLLDIAKNDKEIEILGYVDDVRPYFTMATISVCPIRDGGGTRIKILDAMAMGMPIVATTIGCEGIDVTPGKDLLIADSPEEYIKNIGVILNNENVRKSISISARQKVEDRYSWNSIGSKLNRLYEESLT